MTQNKEAIRLEESLLLIELYRMMFFICHLKKHFFSKNMNVFASIMAIMYELVVKRIFITARFALHRNILL